MSDLTIRPRLLACGAAGLGLSVVLLGLVVWGFQSSYEWDLARCRSLPDHYVPELGWLIFLGPLGLLGLLIMIAVVLMGFLDRYQSKRLPWIVLSIGLIVVLGGLTLAGLLLYGPCPAVS